MVCNTVGYSRMNALLSAVDRNGTIDYIMSSLRIQADWTIVLRIDDGTTLTSVDLRLLLLLLPFALFVFCCCCRPLAAITKDKMGMNLSSRVYFLVRGYVPM
jgi:hypothetical protein